jgi:hypothetical protein
MPADIVALKEGTVPFTVHIAALSIPKKCKGSWVQHMI